MTRVAAPLRLSSFVVTIQKMNMECALRDTLYTVESRSTNGLLRRASRQNLAKTPPFRRLSQ